MHTNVYLLATSQHKKDIIVSHQLCIKYLFLKILLFSNLNSTSISIIFKGENLNEDENMDNFLNLDTLLTNPLDSIPPIQPLYAALEPLQINDTASNKLVHVPNLLVY